MLASLSYVLTYMYVGIYITDSRRFFQLLLHPPKQRTHFTQAFEYLDGKEQPLSHKQALLSSQQPSSANSLLSTIRHVQRTNLPL